MLPSTLDMARFRPVTERKGAQGARSHLGKAGTTERRVGEPPADTDCRGTLRSLWGQQGTPVRWIRAGTICLACGAWWPEEGYPPRPSPR